MKREKKFGLIGILVTITVVIIVSIGVFFYKNDSVITDDLIEVSFCDQKYIADNLILSRTNIIKVIESIANEETGLFRCNAINDYFIIQDKKYNIGISFKKIDNLEDSLNKESDVYRIALYRKGFTKDEDDPFGQSILQFKFDFNDEKVYLQSQFDGNFNLVGNFSFLEGDEKLIENLKETIDWKIYKNEEYGFEFRYPENWKFNGQSIFYDEKGEKILEFFLTPRAMIPGKDGKCLGEFYTIEKLISREDIKINNLKGERLVQLSSYTTEIGSGTWYLIHYCLEGNNRNFTFTFYELNQNPERHAIFDKILSTFKFVDEDFNN